jgi:hypothetical protein
VSAPVYKSKVTVDLHRQERIDEVRAGCRTTGYHSILSGRLEGEVGVYIDVSRLPAYMKRALRSKGGKCRGLNGAIIFKVLTKKEIPLPPDEKDQPIPLSSRTITRRITPKEEDDRHEDGM